MLGVDRLERLINLTAALLETERPLSRHEIQERVPGYSADPDTFRRAFERDKDSLRSMGVPIALERIEPSNPESLDGYLIRTEEYALPDPGLTGEELRALHIAAAAVQLSQSDAQTALRKLGGTLGDDEVINLASVETEPRVASLFEAISAHCAVIFQYNGQQRTVEPHRLTHYRGRWYLAGFDRLRSDIRSYRVDRIEGGVKLLRDDVFAPSPVTGKTTHVRAWELGEEDPVDVELYVDETQVDWVAAQLGTDTHRADQADGGAIFTVHVTNLTGFRTFVLGLLDHAEVLSPKHVRADMVAWLRGFVA